MTQLADAALKNFPESQFASNFGRLLNQHAPAFQNRRQENSGVVADHLR